MTDGIKDVDNIGKWEVPMIGVRVGTKVDTEIIDGDIVGEISSGPNSILVILPKPSANHNFEPSNEIEKLPSILCRDVMSPVATIQLCSASNLPMSASNFWIKPCDTCTTMRKLSSSDNFILLNVGEVPCRVQIMLPENASRQIIVIESTILYTSFPLDETTTFDCVSGDDWKSQFRRS